MIARVSRFVLPAVAFVAVSALPEGASAQQTRAIVTAELNQRAGPSTRYPIVATVPLGRSVALFGCLDDYSWCEGAYRNHRGWFSARYLRIAEGSGGLRQYVPATSFEIEPYWDRYYQDRPFYARLSFYADGGSVGVSIGSFYEPLSPHGYWTDVRGRYVWVPRVDAGWRPYTDGRWAYTERHGWTWVSYEPFGWAAYHYGRWAYSPRIGWFWVPGTTWGPAWVAWRRNDDYLAWAPLPPDPDDGFGISIDISFGDIPNYYWRAVRARDFQAQDIDTVIIGDNNQVINIVNQTEAAGTVNIVNNVVVNNQIDVEFVEQQTGQAVVAHEIALTSSQEEDAEIVDDKIRLYHPTEAELEPAEAPAEVVSEEQIAEESSTAGEFADEPATDDRVPPAPEPGGEVPMDVPAAEAPPVIREEDTPDGATAPAEGAREEAEPTDEVTPAPAGEAAPEAPPAEEGAPEAPAGEPVPEPTEEAAPEEAPAEPVAPEQPAAEAEAAPEAPSEDAAPAATPPAEPAAEAPEAEAPAEPAASEPAQEQPAETRQPQPAPQQEVAPEETAPAPAEAEPAPAPEPAPEPQAAPEEAPAAEPAPPAPEQGEGPPPCPPEEAAQGRC